MQHFQSILIVIGLFAIGGVLIHGYILSRKEKEGAAQSMQNVDMFAEKMSSKKVAEPVDEIVGEVRIVGNNPQEVEDDIDFSLALDDNNVNGAEFVEQKTDESSSFVEEQAVTATFDDFQEVTNAQSDMVEDSLDEPLTEEALITEDEQPQDLFIFNVVAKEDEYLGGHELLQFFLTSGFRFGEMAIFHRHEQSDGTGPVLFSIANMMAPGIFDPENMEQFKSEGVSFFLTVPNKHIDIRASFEMMLRAVEQLADEFDCDVLNADREPMTKEQFIDYNHRLLHYI